jgi:hypothetical protein
MAYVTIGGVFGASSNDFQEDYQNIIGGNSLDFRDTPAFGAGLKFWLEDHYRLSISADYFESKSSDSYSEFDSLSIGTVTRDINNEFNITSIPIVISLDYIPVEQQFKTYVSLGTGILLSRVSWQESVNSNRASDIRIGGTHYDDTDIFPLIRGALGVELDFDQSVTGNIIGNLTIELRYTYMFRNVDMYGKIKNQLNTESSSLENSVELIPGYLSLNLQFGIEYFQTIGK